LKIAVNTRLLLPDKLEGIGWFTFETLRRIVASHPEVKFYFLFDRSPDPSFIFGPNVEAVVLKPPARHPFLYVIWFEWAVKRALDKIQPDLFLSPDGYLSLGSTIPSLSVLHDLNFEHFPDDLPLLARWHYRSFFPRYAQKAARIATVSEFSKQDIMQQYGVPAEKIDVVYNGANELFSPLTIEEQQAVRQRYSEGHPYFLFVGALHPRKNLVRLFQAFDLYRSQSNQQVKLLIVGEKMFRTKAISQTYEGMTYKDEVLFCGRMGTSELHKITASALAITYVSYFEGFGIPIVEAFRCGVPVITSNVTSMPEVAAEAALLCDPYSVESIAEAMETMATDAELRNQLVEKGMERSHIFTWDAAAQRLWNSISMALTQSKK
jgi:glycosyltransferase involved in cell wall biosynthesis